MLVRLLQALAQLLRACRQRQNNKLVTADTENLLLLAAQLLQQIADADNIKIALSMTKIIIAILQLIHINKGDSAGSLLQPQLFYLQIKIKPVAHACQRVRMRTLFQTNTLLLQLTKELIKGLRPLAHAVNRAFLFALGSTLRRQDKLL